MYYIQHSKFGPNHSLICEDPSLHAKRTKIIHFILMFVCIWGYLVFLMFRVQEKYLRDLDSVP